MGSSVDGRRDEPERRGASVEYTPEYMLLKGPLPSLDEMSIDDLRMECEMWRRLWAWVPSEVKYYVARTGKMIAVTQRNYKRYLGYLLETRWDLKELEIGVYDKVYDTVTGKWFYERKIVRIGVNSIIDLQWIEDRVSEEELGEYTPPPMAPPVETVGVEGGGEEDAGGDDLKTGGQ